MRNFICVIVSNTETKEFFIAPEHDDYGLEGFVPTSHYAHKTWTNPPIEIKTIQDVINYFYYDYKDICLMDLVA
jgi:hypothetical protein